MHVKDEKNIVIFLYFLVGGSFIKSPYKEVPKNGTNNFIIDAVAYNFRKKLSCLASQGG
jgi:hypothetical protein